MEIDLRPGAPRTGAMAPLAPGPLITIAEGPLSVEIAPTAGGRIAQIVCDGVEWLVGPNDRTSAAIAWGSYPMVPWAGRIRRGRFDFQGRRYQLPLNLGGHTIHGVAFALPWQVDAHSRSHAELSLALPDDERWPFGGTSRQRFEVGENWLRMTLSATAGERAMPATIGWHPWFREPDRIEFSPTGVYPRDEEGIATRPLAEPPPGPWDDCFINEEPVLIHRAGQSLRLTSDCSHWVVYDEIGYATCIEPQSGPPDGLNLAPMRLSPGASVEAWFLLEWL
jgi:aldose 1-epimerase